jgi:hypothetical protein
MGVLIHTGTSTVRAGGCVGKKQGIRREVPLTEGEGRGWTVSHLEQEMAAICRPYLCPGPVGTNDSLKVLPSSPAHLSPGLHPDARLPSCLVLLSML